MKNRLLKVLLPALLLVSCEKEKKTLLDYVDILIGTAPANTLSAQSRGGDHVDYGQTIPAITAPFGMTQWTPQTRNTERKCVAPFYYGSPALQGFRATHWTSGSCVQDYGSFTIMPVSGDFTYLPTSRAAEYLIDTETLSPAYCAVHIPLYKVITEITATRRCGFFQFSWLDPENPYFVIDVNSDEGEGVIKIDPARREIVAANPVHRIYNGNGKPAGFSGYMVAQFDCDFEKFGTFAGPEYFHEVTEQTGSKDIGAYVGFKPGGNNVVKVRIGTSFTSIENARKNLEAEIPSWDFRKTRANLEKTWEALLGKIEVEGGSEDDRTKFYTAIYHSCIHPRLFSDADGSYKGFNGDTTLHKAEGFDYYTDFSAWDTYRAQMPLLSLIAPREYTGMVRSLVRMAEQGGWLPIFPMWNSYTSAMIGDHCAAIIGDAFLKGFEVEIDKAWPYLRKNAFETPDSLAEYIDGKGRRALPAYLQLGYLPLEDEVPYAFHRREQVSRTLEYAYDDWVLAQVARKLGLEDDYQKLSARALNYANVFDPQKGWVCGRFADGTFTDDFVADGEMPYITEGTPKHYTWYVPQDIPGLMELMGGKELFFEKLNGLVANKEYWHGNEPSHQIPYLFNYADRWDLTQKTVKNILVTEYGTGPGGLSGNDDAGQMSAWYVFSAMGFYPVCPGSNEYQLSSPVFSQVTLQLDKEYYPGGKFVLQAPGENYYGEFNTALLNGKPTPPVLQHDELKKGGKLVFKIR